MALTKARLLVATLIVAAVAVGLVALTVGVGRPVALFSQADLAIIDSAEDQDSSPQVCSSPTFSPALWVWGERGLV